MTMISAFYDHGRRVLVDGMLNDLKALKLSYDFKCPVTNVFTSITAPHGWGKTRLIQELYKRVVADSELNHLELKRVPKSVKHNICFSGYWPHEMATTDFIKRSSLERVRRLLNPTDENRAANTLPAFIWAGIDTSNSHEISQLEIIIDKHLEFLNDSAYFYSSNKEELIKNLRDVVKDGIEDNFISQISSQILSLGELTFGGAVSSAIKSFKTRLEESRNRKQRLNSGMLELSSCETRVLEKIKPIVETGIPLILCIEEFHSANSSTLEFIQEVLDLKGPVFIVATSTETFTFKHDSKKSTLNLKCITNQTQVQSDTIRKIEPLSLQSLHQLICQYYCKTDIKETKRITIDYPTPLLLQLLLELPILKRKVVGDSLTYDLIQSLGIPPSIECLYSEYFNSLSTVRKKMLAILAKLTNQRCIRWSPSIHCFLIEILKVKEEIENHFDREASWIIKSSSGYYSFNSKVHRAISYRYADEHFDNDDINFITKSLIENILTRVSKESDEIDIYLAHQLIRFIMDSDSMSTDSILKHSLVLAKFWFERNLHFQSLVEDLKRQHGTDNTAQICDWVQEKHGFNYSVDSWKPSNYLFSEMIFEMSKSNHSFDHDSIIDFILGINFQFMSNLPTLKMLNLNLIYEDSFSIEYAYILQDVDETINEMSGLLEQESKEVEQHAKDWLARAILEDSVRHGMKSRCTGLLRAACIRLIDENPESKLDDYFAGSLKDELNDIRRFKIVKTEIEKTAKVAARRVAKKKLISELQDIENSLLNSHSVLERLVCEIKISKIKASLARCGK